MEKKKKSRYPYYIIAVGLFIIGALVEINLALAGFWKVEMSALFIGFLVLALCLFGLAWIIKALEE